MTEQRVQDRARALHKARRPCISPVEIVSSSKGEQTRHKEVKDEDIVSERAATVARRLKVECCIYGKSDWPDINDKTWMWCDLYSCALSHLGLKLGGISRFAGLVRRQRVDCPSSQVAKQALLFSLSG